jgi:hypothetical protein
MSHVLLQFALLSPITLKQGGGGQIRADVKSKGTGVIVTSLGTIRTEYIAHENIDCFTNTPHHSIFFMRFKSPVCVCVCVCARAHSFIEYSFKVVNLHGKNIDFCAISQFQGI